MAGFKWLGVLFVGFAISSLAQETSPPAGTSGQTTAPTSPSLIPRSHEERERRYQAEHRIILNVLVTDTSGRTVKGLKQEDFTILDDGTPKGSISFRPMEGSLGLAPAHVILMLDTVNSSPRSVAYERQGVEKFLAQSPKQLEYPTSIGVLSRLGATVSQQSQDRDELVREFRTLVNSVHRYGCEDEGNSSLQLFAGSLFGNVGVHGLSNDSQPGQRASCEDQRFRLSVSSLHRLAMQQIDVPGRAILIWIGPGWPLLSSHEFRPDSPAIKQNFFDYLVQLSTALREGQVTLDAVSSPELFRIEETLSDHDIALVNGVSSEEQVTAGSLALQVLSHQSGGQVLTAGKDLAKEMAQCVADADSYYVLSFDSAPGTRPGEYRSLQVSVKKPGLTVRTNTVYYAQP